MEWYYISDNRQVGPVDEAELARLVSEGILSENALVWHEGLVEWESLDKVRQNAAPENPLQHFLVSGKQACSSCGNLYDLEDLIPFESSHICAACKPNFIQHIKEGTLPVGQMRFGGFWIRGGAAFIDGVILGVFSLATQIVAGIALADSSEVVFLGVYLGLSLIQWAVGAIYEILLVGKYGATLGKMVFRLRVVTSEGDTISYWRSTGRHFAKYVSQLILMIGYIMAAFDAEKRGLHDHMCNTRVVRT